MNAVTSETSLQGIATPTVGDRAKPVCRSELVAPERAVAAKAPDGAQVAIVRTADGALHAVGHHDPYADANVIARGIVGTATVAGETRDVIQSPMYKQAFDLETGQCVSDPEVSIGVWDVDENDGMIVLRYNRIPPRPVA